VDTNHKHNHNGKMLLVKLIVMETAAMIVGVTGTTALKFVHAKVVVVGVYYLTTLTSLIQVLLLIIKIGNIFINVYK